ncbi:MAG: beta-galactosidase [Puniceicoccaceae bacterium 5H]|nr:MAG: beta-galactosidase [Puniceicoccaceae bacterium 5H]
MLATLRRLTLASAILIAGVATTATVTAQSSQPEPGREVVSINDNWKFIKGDPPGYAGELRYDVRPEIEDTNDDRPADAKPEEAEAISAEGQQVLKPWILPSGNDFISDPAQRHARPEGNPGGDAPYVQVDFDDSDWRELDLPHDWAIEGPFLEEGNHGGMGRLPSWGVAWYRKQLDIPASDRGKSIFLDVDGAMSYAAVWLNGQLVGGWPFGYASWRLDLTPYVNFGGENQLAIRLDNPPASSRWYPGAGIYRNVWLTKTHPIHVGHWGTYVTTPQVAPSAAAVAMEVKIDNDAAQAAEVEVETRLYELSPNGQRGSEAVASIEPERVHLPAHGSTTIRGATTVLQPKLWGPPPTQQPHRYVAVTTIRRDGTELDRYETRFGIRELRFDADQGLYVNGEPIQIKGVNNHHDLGSLGAAFNVRAAERQLEMLREMGCNAIRMSHNPPAPELLELTDRMGFLVMDESFDVWERKKTPLDFHLIFPDWHEPDMRALVRRDRNSPSVIIWSIGNEVGEQYTAEDGAAVARDLAAIVYEEDPTRPVTSAMNFAKPDMALPQVLDLISLNYQGEGIRDTPEFEGTERIRTKPQYDAFHETFPGKVILSSETASAFSSRGVYLFPVSPDVSAPVRDGRGGDSSIHQVTAYELHAVDFGSSADKVFASIDRHPFVAGQFVWTGWDHLGEPTPYYSSRSSYAGIIDLAGFKKDRFYLYQSHWRPDYPMAHILPHWTWPERVGEVTPVHVFTSGDAAELFLNGRSLGRKAKEPYQYRLRWDDVKYEPGTLKVVAYQDGKPWATDTVTTAGKPTSLDVTPDRATIQADGNDLAFITVKIVDADGVVAPRADNRIAFSLSGPGEIVSTDNGDPTSFESFQSHERKAFSGYCLVIVRGKPGQPGELTVTATSEGLEAGKTSVQTVAARR